LAIIIVFASCAPFTARAEPVSIYIPTNAAPRVEFGAEKLAEALKAVKLDAAIVRSEPKSGLKIILNPSRDSALGREGFNLIRSRRPVLRSSTAEGGRKEAQTSDPQSAIRNPQSFVVSYNDDSGALYGCLELAKRIRAEGKLPVITDFSDKPVMTLRGTCIGMQKTYILPGRKVYEYPYTPELFPWFYDQALWREYLDFLVANRMNTLYLWNGHPFSSLVRLKDYPEAVEVPGGTNPSSKWTPSYSPRDAGNRSGAAAKRVLPCWQQAKSKNVFAQNVEMFRWLTTECDKRGIWLVQMFYNIFLPKPLAEKHGVSTQLAAPTPLASDYTRKAIAEFVKQYPNVGLMVCLGEALQGTENQINWCTNTILPGVLDGMKAAGLKEQPPVVIRTHAMDAKAIMPACFQVYSNLYTETKYNGESLTTWEPRGKGQATHLAMSQLGPHLVNVHILSNLEPFRYGDQRFIQKCMQAARDRLGASGLHLYPLAYWNWPYSPDIANPPLKQWDRDWIWFEAWARYAWNPDVPEPEDRAYWIGRLADFYGCNTNAAGKILDAYNDAGEVAPRLIRRFGITEGNRQTLSLGMTLDQLVNPKKYSVLPDLWESQSPPGERLQEYVKKEWNHEPHVGETPETVIAEALNYSSNAVVSAASAASLVTRNRAEFERLQNDVHCIQAMAQSYAAKAIAAERVLHYDYSQNVSDMAKAEDVLAESLWYYQTLAQLTGTTYHFANSMQTSQRKIPFPGGVKGVGTNYLWSQLAPLYQKELDDFRARVARLKQSTNAPVAVVNEANIKPWPSAAFKLLSTNAETYEVKVGARPFTDRNYTIRELAPELNGLTGIRFSHEAAKSGRYEPVEFEASEPVQVLVGYFNNPKDIWLQVPNLDFAAQADERGGIEPVIRNAADIEQCPDVNVHAFRYDAGRQKLELIGKGSFVILGIVPQSAKLERRDAGKGMK
jgi:hypothetical protein